MANLITEIFTSVLVGRGSESQAQKQLSSGFFIRRLIQKNKYLKQITV